VSIAWGSAAFCVPTVGKFIRHQLCIAKNGRVAPFVAHPASAKKAKFTHGAIPRLYYHGLSTQVQAFSAFA
jgi:hypothetical protein